MHYTKSISLDTRSINIIEELMSEKNKKFSEAVNFCIHSVDYLLNKIENLRDIKKVEKIEVKEKK